VRVGAQAANLAIAVVAQVVRRAGKSLVRLGDAGRLQTLRRVTAPHLDRATGIGAYQEIPEYREAQHLGRVSGQRAAQEERLGVPFLQRCGQQVGFESSISMAINGTREYLDQAVLSTRVDSITAHGQRKDCSIVRRGRMKNALRACVLDCPQPQRAIARHGRELQAIIVGTSCLLSCLDERQGVDVARVSTDASTESVESHRDGRRRIVAARDRLQYVRNVESLLAYNRPIETANRFNQITDRCMHGSHHGLNREPPTLIDVSWQPTNSVLARSAIEYMSPVCPVSTARHCKLSSAQMRIVLSPAAEISIPAPIAMHRTLCLCPINEPLR